MNQLKINDVSICETVVTLKPTETNILNPLVFKWVIIVNRWFSTAQLDFNGLV